MTHQVFDVHRAAANVLGKEWTARTPSEQEEFANLFGDVLQRGYLALVGSKVKITGGVHVTFIDETVAGDVAVVRTALTARSNGELSIDYRMTSDPVGTISAEARRRGIPEAEINLIPEGLRELGYVAGQNIIVDYRYAAGNVARLHPLASKLVQLKVAVLVAR